MVSVSSSHPCPIIPLADYGRFQEWKTPEGRRVQFSFPDDDMFSGEDDDLAPKHEIESSKDEVKTAELQVAIDILRDSLGFLSPEFRRAMQQS